MGTVHFNGLHWNSPVTNRPHQQYTAGQQFAAAFILASGNISYGGCSTSYNGWKEQCVWIRQNTSRTAEIALRLYWPMGNCMTGDPGQSLATQFYNEIIVPAVSQYGIRNFQVLNELNIEYEGSKSRQLLGGDMFNIAWWIKHLANQSGLGFIYLGFPGPGGNAVVSRLLCKFPKDFRNLRDFGSLINLYTIFAIPSGTLPIRSISRRTGMHTGMPTALS